MLTARLLDSLLDVAAAEWDALHDGRNPFVSHAFLAGLEQHGCVRPDLGWTPRHLALYDGDRLVAAVPGYRKRNSHGEFVFDHAWAHAYLQHGRDYYPKWLGAVPYTPVTGPRLLAVDEGARGALPDAIREMATAAGESSAHVNFHEERDDACFDAGWIQRLDVQYHWRNDAGWSDFDAFLRAMDHRHRKNIRQERSKVRQSGVEFRVVHGDEATEEDLFAMHGFYLRTFRDYGNTPALTLGFLRHLARAMPRQLVLFLARLGDAPSPARSACAAATPCTAATGARTKCCPACISKPAITRASNTACAKACACSSRARRASTSWRAASCRRWCAAGTGSPIRRSPRRSALVRGGTHRCLRHAAVLRPIPRSGRRVMPGNPPG